MNSDAFIRGIVDGFIWFFAYMGIAHLFWIYPRERARRVAAERELETLRRMAAERGIPAEDVSNQNGDA